MDYKKSKKLSGSVYGSNVMNYTWYYVVRINTKHKVAGWMPCLADRARANYRLKNARGVWNIRRSKLNGFSLYEISKINGSGMYEIWKTGTIYPRCADSYHKVFCDLYNLGREV